MDKQPIWKPAVIAILLALSIACIYPPEKKLRPGLDLAGGTTLIYQVNLPPGTSNPSGEINEIINTLGQRVDPLGVRNLTWRQQTGNRIEIQMPLPSPVTSQRRKEYIALRDKLFDGNVSPRKLEAALRLSADQRGAYLDRLAGGNATLRKAMDEAVAAHEKVEAARIKKNPVQEALWKAEEALQSLPADAPEADRKKLEAQCESLRAEIKPLAEALTQAEAAAAPASAAVTVSNIEPADFERILTLDNKKPVGKEAGVTQRETEVVKLIAAHPAREKELREVLRSYSEYEAVKGELDDPNDLIALLRGSGVLEFRISARAGEVPDEGQYREQLDKSGPRAGATKPLRWFQIDDPERFFEDPKLQAILFPADNVRGEPWKISVRQVFAARGMIGQPWGNGFYVLLGNGPSDSLTQAKKGWALKGASGSFDQNGLPAVAFELNPLGGDEMGRLTRAHLQRPMAVVLDDRVITAPTIQSQITNSGQITGGRGGFTEREREYLVRTLKAGALNARLSEQPISIQTTGPQFGQDNLHAGLLSAYASAIIVALFMAVYYFMLGWVANFAMVLNILLLLAAMAVTQATFTLSGIAGVVLSIGMAVDANVLIYERIREEIERKNSLRAAVRLGWQKAFATIIDAHVTTLITCVILIYMGTADVRGFGVTLMIGLLANIFTAVFVSRVIVDVLIERLHLTSLGMLTLKFPAIHRAFTPNVDWVGKRYIFFGISAVLTVGGIVAIWSRGIDFFDIEFRGGTQVGFELAKDEQGKPKLLSIVEVRQRLKGYATAELERLAATKPDREKLEAAKREFEKISDALPVTVGDTQDGKASKFTIQTLSDDPAFVSAAIKTAFKDVLDVQQSVRFKGVGETNASAPPIAQAPAFPIRESSLGANIGRADIREDASEYIGGVAIVLEDLTPAVSVEEVDQRVARMRFQPEYERLGFRTHTVFGLQRAADNAVTRDGKALYSSVVVVSHQEQTNYADNPDQFTEPGGLAATEWALVRDALIRDTSLGSVSNFSSQVSGTMKQQAIVAIVLSWLAITAYIWFRFGNLAYGVGAIVALVHDVITAVGFAAFAFYIHDTFIGRALLLQPFRIDLTMITAVLTLIGYSVNDTIVTFDRIRENRGKLAFATPQIINDSINQTFSRSILTVSTVLVSVLVMYVVGGPGVHNFAFIMIVGALIGCYSSIAVASPLLLIGHMGAKLTTAEAAQRNAPAPTRS